MTNDIYQQFFGYELYNKKYISVAASIIDKCNYNCKYCCNNFPRTNKLLDLIQLSKFLKQLKSNKQKNIQITLIGGETLLHPQLKMFCEDMYNNDISCVIFSNFSFNIENYLQFPSQTSFILTWHNDINDIFIKNINSIPLSQLNRFRFYVMYEHFNIQQSIHIFNYIAHKTKKVSLKKIFNTYAYQHTYSINDINLFNDIVNNSIINGISAEDIFVIEQNSQQFLYNNIIVNEDINPFKHCTCYAGIDNLHITHDGDIYPCVTLCSDNKYKLGNIFINKNIFNFKHILLCTANRCCNYDVKKNNILKKQIKISFANKK